MYELNVLYTEREARNKKTPYSEGVFYS